MPNKNNSSIGSWCGRRLPAHQHGLAVVGLIVALGLSACPSAPVGFEPPPPVRHPYSLTVALAATDTEASLKDAFGGSVVAWHPESAFAVLALDRSATSLQGNSLAQPAAQPSLEAYALAGSVWAGGREAWAGGSSAWAGGSAAWAGGSAAWAGGWGTAPVGTGFRQISERNAESFLTASSSPASETFGAESLY